jgi:hypothetical protein
VKTLVVPEGGELPPESEDEPVEAVAEAGDAGELESEPADVTTE